MLKNSHSCNCQRNNESIISTSKGNPGGGVIQDHYGRWFVVLQFVYHCYRMVNKVADGLVNMGCSLKFGIMGCSLKFGLRVNCQILIQFYFSDLLVQLYKNNINFKKHYFWPNDFQEKTNKIKTKVVFNEVKIFYF